MEQPYYCCWDPVIAPSRLTFCKAKLFAKWRDGVFVGGPRGTALSRLEMNGYHVVAE